VRNQAGISILNFGIMQRNSVFRHLKGIMQRIMTIHKSKGLEFPVVIMPLQRRIIKPDKLWLDGEEMDFGLPAFN
jgi:superfamily I DNA/RNA helicase